MIKYQYKAKESYTKDKDISTELLRIFAILLVIGTHSKQSFFINGTPDIARVMMACITGDGVAIFWAILGFYQYKRIKSDYRVTVYNSIKNIFWPLILFTSFMFYFSGFLLEGKSFLDSIIHPAVQYKTLFLGFIQWKNVVPYTGHMWFLYVYILVSLMIPCYYGIYIYIDKKDQNVRRDICLLGVLYLVLLLNDFFQNNILRFSHYSFNGVLAASFFIVLGHVLYKYKAAISGKLKFLAIGFLVVILSNAIRCIIQYNYFLINHSNTKAIYWFTNYGFVNVIGLVLIAWSIESFVMKISWLKCMVLRLGRLTFYIYMVHYLVLQKTRVLGLPLYFKNLLGASWMGTCVYEVVYTVLVYIIALIIASGLTLIVNYFKIHILCTSD